MQIFRVMAPTRVVAGHHALSELGAEVAKLGHRALIVSDQGVRAAGLIDPVTESFKAHGISSEVYDDVESNPTVENVTGALQRLKAIEAEVVIGVGGGSPMDTAKAAAVLATNGGAVVDYEGFEKLKLRPLPVITVPTTVGTGSEVTKGAVISDHQLHRKLIVVSDWMYARSAYLDPRMVRNLPASICAATALDALTHAIEGYVALGANPFSDALNVKAIEMIGRYLRPAVAGREEALHQMQIAACLAGNGFHNAGLGLVHALASTVGGHYPVHHGVTNGIILPHVMAFNLIAAPERFGDIARALGEKVDGLNVSDAAERAVAAVHRLIRDVGMPARLRELGVKEESLPAIAAGSLSQLDRPPNPRKNTEKDLLRILQQAF
jgi:alcohol dehydrogenase class IV